jgi:hypothetical protein
MPGAVRQGQDPAMRNRGSALARRLAMFSLLAIAGSFAAATAGEVSRPGGMNLTGPTVSELVFTSVGAWLVAPSMVLLAAGSVAGFVALAGLGVSDRRIWALVTTWSAGLLTAAIFPMEPVGAAMTWRGSLHRYAALVGFVCLPLAGALLSRLLRADPGRPWPCRPLLPLSAVSLSAVALFTVTFAVPVRHYSGAAERVLLLADIALLVTVALGVLRAARAPTESAG